MATPQGGMTPSPQRRMPTTPDEVYAGVDTSGAHDLGPWIETPSSTRVSRFRFDHLQRQLQVQWRNGKGPGYVYENVDYERMRSFARAASKGRRINSDLDNLVYRPMQGEEELPSNPRRSGVSSRLRT